MGALIWEDITVTDKDDRSVPAKLQMCPCGGREWFVYSLQVGAISHPHLQCVECGETYCDGRCEGEVAADMEVTS